MGSLFGDAPEPDDIETGTIYVLRNLSDHPYIAEHRELLHKIGVTGGSVETRIGCAEKDATYLLAAVQLDVTIEDRFGFPVKPREWFLVPLPVIDEAVQRIRDGAITNVVYDPKTARLVAR